MIGIGIPLTKNKLIEVLLLAYSESSLDYYADHKDNGRTVGICGVLPEYWEEYLSEKNIPVNSLRACYSIYNKLLEEHDGSRDKALIKYKGIKSKDKLWIVNKIKKVEKEVKTQNK